MILEKINFLIKKINTLKENERRLTFIATFLIISAIFYFPFALPLTKTIKEYQEISSSNELSIALAEKEKNLALIKNNPNDKIKEKIILKKEEYNQLKNKVNKSNMISKIDLVDILKKTEAGFNDLKIEKIVFNASTPLSETDKNFYKHTIEISLIGNYKSFKSYLDKIKNDGNLNIDQLIVKSGNRNSYTFVLSKIDEYKEWK